MKKQGLGIIGIIVLIGLIALIVWGLNYITTKDYVTLRAPLSSISNSVSGTILPTTSQVASTTATSTMPQVNIVATSTPAKVPTETTVTTTPPATQTTSGLTVTFTDKGFSPASLTVKKGQTVTFVNNSSGKLWVAANPFPTSSEYPAFNEKSGISNGDSWGFTFNQTGTWFYHDHYSPALGAKIVVNAK
jgi:plastocyanin